MNKIKFILLALLICSSNILSKQLTIGLTKDAGTGLPGLFVSFRFVLACLPWHEKTKVPLAVYWDKKSVYYQPEGFNGVKDNVWEYYFEPLSKAQPSKPFHAMYCAPDNSYILSFNTMNKIDKPYRRYVNYFIKKYIKIKAPILKKIYDFYQANMAGKKTVGIHVRGTDHYEEVNAEPLSVIINKANEFKDVQYLVATDEQKILDELKKYLNGKVISYDCYRSTDGYSIQPSHHNIKRPHPAQYGEDVIVEVSLLSKCDIFLHGLSNVAMAVLYFNPESDNYHFGKTVH